MPREQLNTPARRVITEPTKTNGLQPGEWAMGWAEDGEPLHDGEHWENTPTLYVGWAKNDDGLDHGMQIYIDIEATEVLRAADAIRENKEKTGYLQESWQFYTVSLKRDEAQKIIRVTRRARDAVFDADE
jgi:hypothetical protein